MTRRLIWLVVALTAGVVAVVSLAPGSSSTLQRPAQKSAGFLRAPAAIAATVTTPYSNAPSNINGVINENPPSATPSVTPSAATAPQSLVRTVQIAPYNDASVVSSGSWTADQNLGGWTQLGVGPQQGGMFRSYLRFLVGGLPAGMQIDSALLILSPIDGGTQPVPIEADYVLDPWDESTITWNQQPLSTYRAGATTWQPGTRGPVSIDVTEAALEWYACGGTSNNGLLLSADLAPGWVDFGSRKSNTAPVLQVTYQAALAPVNCAAPATTTVNLTSPSGVSSTTSGAQIGAVVAGTPYNPNPPPVAPAGNGGGQSGPGSLP